MAAQIDLKKNLAEVFCQVTTNHSYHAQYSSSYRPRVISYAMSANCRAEDNGLFCPIISQRLASWLSRDGLISAATGPAGRTPAFVYLFVRL